MWLWRRPSRRRKSEGLNSFVHLITLGTPSLSFGLACEGSNYFFGVCSWRKSLGGYWAEKGGISTSLSSFPLSLAIGDFDLGSLYLMTSTAHFRFLCFTGSAGCNWDYLACLQGLLFSRHLHLASERAFRFVCVCICTHHMKEAILLPRYMVLAMVRTACIHALLAASNIYKGGIGTYRETSSDGVMTCSRIITRHLLGKGGERGARTQSNPFPAGTIWSMSLIYITIDPLATEYSAPHAKDQGPQRPVLVLESEIGRNRCQISRGADRSPISQCQFKCQTV